MCKPLSSPPSPASLLLELAAANDLAAFTAAAHAQDDLTATAPWYGPSGNGRRNSTEERTPSMIAALYGSSAVLSHILSAAPAEARRRSPSDGSTPLHCAAAGASPFAADVARLIFAAAPDAVDILDNLGRRPADVIPQQLKSMQNLNIFLFNSNSTPPVKKDGDMKIQLDLPRDSSPVKDEEMKFPLDSTLPDIKAGIFTTDEFRMYTFKVRPCSRAYSHDWTECPFVHPGENARRRDPRKFTYSCVPCPEFRKAASCRNGDNCEYAHGVFESWLHPAQYRTRLCKDEIGCNRRVCFFAHKPEELRQVNHAAVSVAAGMMVSSPKAGNLSSPSLSGLDMATALMLMQQQQQQPGSPMSPSGGSVAGGWMNQNTPPSLQLPASRLKASLSARDLDFDLELLGLESYQNRLIDEISASPRTNWSAASRGSEFNDLLGSVDPSLLNQLQGLSVKQQSGTQFQSPTGIQKMHQSQMLSGYGNNMPLSPPVTASMASSFGADQSMAKAIMNSRASAFAKRSQSFIDRGSVAARQSTLSAMTTADAAPSVLADWGSPTGKLDWGVQGEELNKLRKSASFNYRNNNQPVRGIASASLPPGFDEHNLPWVQPLVTEAPTTPQAVRKLSLSNQQKGYQVNIGSDLHGSEMMPLWAENDKIMA